MERYDDKRDKRASDDENDNQNNGNYYINEREIDDDQSKLLYENIYEDMTPEQVAAFKAPDPNVQYAQFNSLNLPTDLDIYKNDNELESESDIQELISTTAQLLQKFDSDDESGKYEDQEGKIGKQENPQKSNSEITPPVITEEMPAQLFSEQDPIDNNVGALEENDSKKEATPPIISPGFN